MIKRDRDPATNSKKRLISEIGKRLNVKLITALVVIIVEGMGFLGFFIPLVDDFIKDSGKPSFSIG